MASALTPDTCAAPSGRWTWQTLARPKRHAQLHLVDLAHRSTLDESAQAIPTVLDLPPPLPTGEGWIVGRLWEEGPGGQNNPVDVEVGDKAAEIGGRWTDAFPGAAPDLDELPTTLQGEMCLSYLDRLKLVMGR